MDLSPLYTTKFRVHQACTATAMLVLQRL
jgi:hypothetical protein